MKKDTKKDTKKKNNSVSEEKTAQKKSSIEKSHSVWSNTKLTLLSFLASCSFSGFFVFLGLKGHFGDAVFYTGTVACALFIVLTAYIFKDFKR